MSAHFYPQCRAILQVIFDGFGDTARDSDVFVIPVLPKAATIHRNSYRQADSWEITLDAGDFPFDPELVRAGSAEVYFFQTDGLGGGERVVSRKLSGLDDGTAFAPRAPVDAVALEQGIPSAVDRFTAGNRPLVAGLFDSIDVDYGDGGKWVTIGGQDYTAHLNSLQWPPTAQGVARRVPVGRRLDETIRAILAEADPGGVLALDVRGLEPSKLPIVGASEVRGSKRGIPVDQNTTYWDVIYKLATRHGLIAYVDGLDVVIARPNNLTAADEHRVKRLAWGRNVLSLNLARKLGKEQSPTIVVQGYDDSGREGIRVEYPPNSIGRDTVASTTKAGKTRFKSPTKKTTRTSKTGKVTTTIRNRDEYQFVPAYGITDPKILGAMAESLYVLQGRAERVAKITTRDLRDERGSDMLDTKSGDAWSVEFNDYNRELISNPRVPIQAKVEHLRARGYNEAVARAVAENHSRLEGIRRPLRVREATLEYDSDGPTTIEAELVDFVVVDGARSAADKVTRAEKRDQLLIRRDGTRVGIGDDRRTEDAVLGRPR